MCFKVTVQLMFIVLFSHYFLMRDEDYKKGKSNNLQPAFFRIEILVIFNKIVACIPAHIETKEIFGIRLVYNY